MKPKPSRIAMFNLSETTRDPRVRRIAGSLAAHGHEVVVWGFKGESRVAQEGVDNFVVRRLKVTAELTIRELAGIRQTSPTVYQQLESCDPEIFRFDLVRCLALPGWKYGLFAFNAAVRKFPSLLRHLGCDLTPIARRQYEISGIRMLIKMNLDLFREAIKYRPQVVHCNDLNTLLAGVLVQQHTGARLVYDAHEIYPEQFDDKTYTPAWKLFYTLLEKNLLEHTDLRLTVCDSIAEYFQSYYGSQSFTTVRNVPSRRFLSSPAVLDRHNQPRKILYHGAYFPHRGLEQVIEAAATVPNAVFVFRGIGAHEAVLRQMVVERVLQQRVQFMPPVPVNELIHYASECDIGLNPFIPVCLNTTFALPNKFFEYMSAGLAVASADLVEMRHLTDKHRLGIVFDPTDPGKISAALRTLLSDEKTLNEYRRHAYEAAKSEYHWEKEEEKLLSAYAQLAPAAGSARSEPQTYHPRRIAG